MSLTPRLDRLEKNLLINGGMDFFQRLGTGAGPIGTSPGWSGPDRFLVNYTGTVTGTPTCQRVASNAGNYLSQNAIQFALRRNGTTATLAAQQRVESANCRDLIARGVGSFSVRVNVPISGVQVRLTLNYATALDNFTSVTQIVQTTSSQTITASTWTTVTFPAISIPTAAANGVSAIVELLIPTGTDGAALNYQMTQFTLASNTDAVDFSMAGRNISEELVYCQRYYEKSYSPDIAPGSVSDFGRQLCIVTSSNVTLNSFKFSTAKRIQGWTLFWKVDGTANNIDVAGTDRGVNIATTSSCSNQFSCNIVMNSSGATGQYANFHWAADAEI